MWVQEDAMHNAVERARMDHATLRRIADTLTGAVAAGTVDSATALAKIADVLAKQESTYTALSERWDELQQVINGMSVGEASRISGLHRQTIYTLIRTGTLAATRLPSGGVAVNRESLEHYMERQRARAARADPDTAYESWRDARDAAAMPETTSVDEHAPAF